MSSNKNEPEDSPSDLVFCSYSARYVITEDFLVAANKITSDQLEQERECIVEVLVYPTESKEWVQQSIFGKDGDQERLKTSSLELCCPAETPVLMKMFSVCSAQCGSHKLQTILSTSNVASATETLSFLFYFYEIQIATCG